MPTAPCLRVVVADDSALVRQRVVEALADVPRVCVVAEAEDGVAAVARVDEHRPDVLVLDLRMPGLTGLQVLDRVHAAFPAVHVVLLTNHAEPAYRRACLARGAEGFFDKTTEFDRLAPALRAWAPGAA